MSVGESNSVPSEVDLSSAQFGYDEMEEKFALHLSDDLEPVALKDWTAQDFANIYVRFRPHLEAHARKYLRNPSQVEEVVQDAFLYLMTSLPELDSELGVLRFLKWKTKMLALDVIRASAKAPLAVESDFLEQTGEADERELSEALERADDTAIVNMAFAKLSSRHREALVAAVYEEKSHEQAAKDMGLTENAFRQLLFRARSAFKKALVGEAETTGLSASQILSIAARKAANDRAKYIGSVSALVLVASFFGTDFIGPAQRMDASTGPAIVIEANSVPDGKPNDEAAKVETENLGWEIVSADPPSGLDSDGALDADLTVPFLGEESEPSTLETPPLVGPDPDDAGESGDLLSLATFLTQTQVPDLLESFGDFVARDQNNLSLSSIRDGNSLSADLIWDEESRMIRYVWLELELATGEQLVLVPQTVHQEATTNSSGESQLNFVATDFLIGDQKGDFGNIADTFEDMKSIAIKIQIRSSSGILETPSVGFIRSGSTA